MHKLKTYAQRKAGSKTMMKREREEEKEKMREKEGGKKNTRISASGTIETAD